MPGAAQRCHDGTVGRDDVPRELLALRGVGVEVASTLLVAVGDHRVRTPARGRRGGAIASPWRA